MTRGRSPPPFLGIVDKDGLIRSALSGESLARRMTMVVDNNRATRRAGGRQGSKVALSVTSGGKDREGLAQEKSPTGHSCNPRTKPSLPSFGFRAGLKVDGHAVGKRLPEAAASLDVAEAAGAATEERCFPLEIKERAPSMENVRKEKERKRGRVRGKEEARAGARNRVEHRERIK